ncbi:MAG TPA: hypothetical protein VGS19_05455 [Streptosporangiaceae bacterium]|nr:hypothetical protein [Streptosporangiaceae bacterium]
MRVPLRRGTTVAGAVLCAMATTGTLPAQAATTPAWRVAHLFTHSPLRNLLGFTVTGPNDAWAFGDGTHSQPTAVHWNGTTWTAAALPGATSSPGHASSTSATNVWAADGGDCGPTPIAAFVSRWNGTAWRTTRFPKSSTLCVSSVVTTGPSDGWLFSNNGGTSTQAMHYNGTTWQSVSMGNVGAVLAAWGVSATDVWALTYTQTNKMLAVQWNGRTWASVPLNEPALPPGDHAYPLDIKALGPDNVWATAQLVNHNGQVTGPDNSYVLHWDGRSWRWTPLPHSDVTQYVAPDGASGAWVAAVTNDITGVSAFLHFTGGQWTTDPVPHKGIPGTGVNEVLYTLALVPGTQSLMSSADVSYDPNPTQTVTHAVIYQYGP